MTSSVRLAAAASLVAMLPGTAVAAPASPLQIEMRTAVETRVRAADGTTTTRLVRAVHVVPGSAMQITVSYRNTGTAPLAGVLITNPVPASTSYRGVAAGTPEPEVSADGVHFASLATLSVPDPVAGTRRAVPSDVTAVRWRLAAPLTAGAAGQFAFTAVVR